ncbi:MAG TPA: hypothetical protein VMX75_15920, partial [Spirochaetia bacterium]|nr:hypothetical protein [Spirochaetia bacterium]
SAAHYGKRALQPIRRVGESWEQCAWRAMEGGPDWFVQRATRIIEGCIRWHAHHCTEPLMETVPCRRCPTQCPGSWKRIAHVVYAADPWSQQQQIVRQPLEPYILRQGARGWYEDGKQGVIRW